MSEWMNKWMLCVQSGAAVQQQFVCVNGWMNEWMNEWVNEWMNVVCTIRSGCTAAVCLCEWMNKWMLCVQSGAAVQQQFVCVNGWMNEWINEWVNEWMNEWMNVVCTIRSGCTAAVCLCEWMNEWMSEWMNKWINECCVYNQERLYSSSLSVCHSGRLRASICRRYGQRLSSYTPGPSDAA